MPDNNSPIKWIEEWNIAMWLWRFCFCYILKYSWCLRGFLVRYCVDPRALFCIEMGLQWAENLKLTMFHLLLLSCFDATLLESLCRKGKEMRHKEGWSRALPMKRHSGLRAPHYCGCGSFSILWVYFHVSYVFFSSNFGVSLCRPRGPVSVCYCADSGWNVFRTHCITCHFFSCFDVILLKKVSRKGEKKKMLVHDLPQNGLRNELSPCCCGGSVVCRCLLTRFLFFLHLFLIWLDMFTSILLCSILCLHC